MARGWLAPLAYLNLACILGLVGLIHIAGEKCWAVTLVLFGPTWLLLLPLACLAPVALSVQRKPPVLVALALAGVVLPGPVLGFAIPWQRLVAGARSAPKLRVMTWNAGAHKVTDAEWAALLDGHYPDVVVVQECVTEALVRPGWYFQNTLGMCLLSRYRVTAIADRDRKDVWADGGSGAIVRYSVAAPFGGIEITNVHLETPREGLQSVVHLAVRTGIRELGAKNAQRYREAALARSWVDAGSSPARIVAGDFNTPPQSDLIRGVWSDFTNCFDAAGFGLGHTKLTHLVGVRIDHVLASRGWRCASAEVVRGEGSDHSPVVVDLEWLGPALTAQAPSRE